MVAVDLDDTVWATWPVLDRCQERYYTWLAETFPSMAKHYPRDTFYALCMKIAEKCPEHSHCLSTLRREALRVASRDPRVEEEVQTAIEALGKEEASIETAVVQPLFDRFIKERSTVDGHLFVGAKEALVKLRVEGLPGGGVVPVVGEGAGASGVKMAGGAFAAATGQAGGAAAKAAAGEEGEECRPLRPIVVALTDGNADVKQTGLGGLFDLAVNPELAGGKKASGKPFEHVLALARAKFGLSEEQLSAAHCVHVGDSVASDISPGLAAGFRCVRPFDSRMTNTTDYSLFVSLQNRPRAYRI